MPTSRRHGDRGVTSSSGAGTTCSGPDEIEAKVPVPEWDMGLGISITTEHCIAYPVVIDEEVYDMFLAVLDAARWTLGADALSKRVIGSPLVSEVKS